ncbi:glycosyltransferase family 4 protein [Cohnella lubricantis]|uniref:Glycosyltransferase family 4 protein n=1 Tax=Cohnella lubricantis TaxID=2163172 RepID=A0A841TG46_9BACL|nr:glycosyltransferase family 4 protein [Cohnella lubricantis]MBB6678909.1 glycosyltransferase family 4 protein [Cohnella lubricantis]MBP2120349.1 glycosyltransferase involved in cell wall biosynthesis [Cohnella lubricantis]
MTADRPRLLLFSHICSPVHFTGAEKLLIAFAKELQRFFTCVLVVPNEGAIAAEARSRGMEVRILSIPLSVAMYVAMPHLGDELRTLRSSQAWDSLIELLQSERPGYVWSNTCVHPLPAMAAKALGIPVIWALMETISAGPNRDEAAGVIDAHSERIVGISYTVLSPFPQEVLAKAAVLPPFIEREALLESSWPYNRHIQRRSNGWGDHHLVVGYIASTIYPNKGLKEYLQAVLPLAARDARIRLLIAGTPTDDAYVGECREYIRKTGLADRTAWVSFTPQIQQVYPAMDVVVVPSLVAEGFGMAALEGMAFGKPVVSFASGGLSEILEATGNADFLVQPGDIAGLTGAVSRLLTNDSLREEVGRRNAQAATEQFGVEVFRRRLESFLSALPAAEDPLPELARGSGPTIYRIENGRRRPFPSMNVLLGLGYRAEDAVQLPDDRLSLVPLGQPMALPAAGLQRGSRRRVNRRRRRRSMRAGARRPKRSIRGGKRAGSVRLAKRIQRTRRAQRARRSGRTGTTARIARTGRRSNARKKR